LQLGIYFAGCLTVTALQIKLHLVGDGLVPLAGQHVEHRLGTDNLRGGRDQRGKAEVGTHTGNLLEDFLNPAQGILLLQLVGQIRHHAAGYLIDLYSGVHASENHSRTGGTSCARRGKYIPISCSSSRSRPVSKGVPRSAATIDSVPGWLVPQAMLENGGIDMVSAVLDGLELAHGGQAGGIV